MNLSTDFDRADFANGDAMAGPVRKFLFDRSFDGPFVEEAAAPEPPKPLYTEEDMLAAKQESFDAGVAAGHNTACDEEIQRQGDFTKSLAARLESFIGGSDKVWQDQLAYLEEVALLIARKIMPTFVARGGEEEIAAMIQKIVADMAREPRLVIRISENAFDTIKPRIDEITAQTAYPGKIVVLSEASFGPSDCRIEWADGGIERDLKKLWDDIDHVMESNGATLPPLPLDTDPVPEASPEMPQNNAGEV